MYTPVRKEESTGKKFLIVANWINAIGLGLMTLTLMTEHDSNPEIGFLIPIIFVGTIIVLVHAGLIGGVHNQYRNGTAIYFIIIGILQSFFLVGILNIIGGAMCISYNNSKLRAKEESKRDSQQLEVLNKIASNSAIPSLEKKEPVKEVSSVDSLSEDLRKLKELKNEGLLTDEEFEKLRVELISKLEDRDK